MVVTVEFDLRILKEPLDVGFLSCVAGLGTGSIFAKQYDVNGKYLSARTEKKHGFFYIWSLCSLRILVSYF